MIYYRLHQGNKLVAVTVADRMLDGLAAIYSFFDPDQPRSLGAEAILLRIREARAWTYLLSTSGTGSMGAEKCPTKRDFPA